MAFKALTLIIICLSTLEYLLPHGAANEARYLYSVPAYFADPACANPIGFANHMIRAPLPNSPNLGIKLSVIYDHLIFYYTDMNIEISQAAFASFCLDQCIAYQPNSSAPAVADLPNPLPPKYVSPRPGPCKAFTVDMGQPYPPNPNDTALRWYCEAFDKYLEEDLSDYEPANAPGSYMHALGVNRDCGGSYRAY